MRSKLRKQRDHYKRIAETELAIYNKDGDILGPVSFESLILIWKFGGYTVDDIELYHDLRMRLLHKD